ncbi:MAG: hypothetical protein WBZ36_26370 [Candidatus Nitrosopolaris sp.]
MKSSTTHAEMTHEAFLTRYSMFNRYVWEHVINETYDIVTGSPLVIVMYVTLLQGILLRSSL